RWPRACPGPAWKEENRAGQAGTGRNPPCSVPGRASSLRSPAEEAVHPNRWQVRRSSGGLVVILATGRIMTRWTSHWRRPGSHLLTWNDPPRSKYLRLIRPLFDDCQEISLNSTTQFIGTWICSCVLTSIAAICVELLIIFRPVRTTEKDLLSLRTRSFGRLNSVILRSASTAWATWSWVIEVPLRQSHERRIFWLNDCHCTNNPVRFSVRGVPRISSAHREGAPGKRTHACQDNSEA